jgi:RHS repeat-associated protein
VLVAPNTGTTIGYSYDDASTGALSTVTALSGQLFRYHNDLAGRLDSLIAPTANGGQSLTTAFSYSDDGDLLQRIQMSGASSFHRDSLLYDARGKAVKSYTLLDSTFTVYSGLGNLLYAKHRSPTGYQNWEETFTVDALGNQHQKIGTGFQGLNPMNSNTTYTYASGRLTNSTDSQGGGASSQNLFDAAGNRTMSYSQIGSKLEEIKSFYSPDGMLRRVDRRVCLNTNCDVSARGALEDYRYDALGRRVLVHSLRDWCSAPGDCRSNIMRVVWDGDQILGEIRMPGYSNTHADTLEADTVSFKPPPGPSCPPLPPPEGCNPADTLPSAAPYYGHVTYTHGLGIDQPLEVLRGGFHSFVQDQFAVVPLLSWRGLYDSGVFPQSGPIIKWPASSTEILKYDLDADDDRGNWFGGLIYENRDMGGGQYMRNRYYDATTGRFTQEDPVGLAGGLNLYGFASGDPVNFADPFGLCPPMPTCVLALGGGGSLTIASGATLTVPGVSAVVATAAEATPVVALGVIGGAMLRPAFPGGGTLMTHPSAGSLAASDATVVYNHLESAVPLEASKLSGRLRRFLIGLGLGGLIVSGPLTGEEQLHDLEKPMGGEQVDDQKKKPAAGGSGTGGSSGGSGSGGNE